MSSPRFVSFFNISFEGMLPLLYLRQQREAQILLEYKFVGNNELHIAGFKKEKMRGFDGQKSFTKSFSVSSEIRLWAQVWSRQDQIDKKVRASIRKVRKSKLIREKQPSSSVHIKTHRDGYSISSIVKTLNEEGVLGRNKFENF